MLPQLTDWRSTVGWHDASYRAEGNTGSAWKTGGDIGSSRAREAARLQGTFVSLNSEVCAAEWAKEVAAMARINMSTIM